MTRAGCRLAERTTVVVGARTEVGIACARKAGEEGAAVVLVDEDSEVHAAIERLAGEGLAVTGYRAHPADTTQLAMAAQECRRSGIERVHALLNCHFRLDWTSVEESTDSEWLASLQMNLLGPVAASRAFLPLLRASGSGSIVNLGSIDGALGNPGLPMYSAAKGGLAAVTHVMAHEFAPYGIRVNVVARGAVTGGGGQASPEHLASVVAATPLGRPATSEEVAAAFLFLASEDASYITGTTLVVDGGRSGLTPGTL